MERPRCKECDRAGKRLSYRVGQKGRTTISEYYICPICKAIMENKPATDRTDIVLTWL